MDKIHPVQRHDVIRNQARSWVLKFNSDTPVTQNDIIALQEWSNRSPVHRAELERAEMFWCDADLLSELAVPVGRRASVSLLRFLPQLPFGRWCLSRVSAVTAVVCLVMMVAVSSWLSPFSDAVRNGTYTTAIGEQRILILSDKSQIQLDTNSQVRVDYMDGGRQIQLLRGKAHFDVAKNPQSPFEVYARGGMVRAVGTAFSVYLTDKDIQVTVNEGRVDLARVNRVMVEDAPVPNESSVSPKDTSTENVSFDRMPKNTLGIFGSLDKGQSALFNHQREEISELADKDLSRELAWRRGLLIFAGSPLREVISEVSRYTKTQIEISDPELGDLMIGGRFRVGELEALFDVLEAGFGVQISYIDKNYIQLHSSSQ